MVSSKFKRTIVDTSAITITCSTIGYDGLNIGSDIADDYSTNHNNVDDFNANTNSFNPNIDEDDDFSDDNNDFPADDYSDVSNND